MKPLRDQEDYKFGSLSVQASSAHYCTPRQDSLDFDSYDAYEVAVISPEDGLCAPSDTLTGWAKRRWVRAFHPRAKAAKRLDVLFEDGDSPVAGWVTRANVDSLRKFLQGT